MFKTIQRSVELGVSAALDILSLGATSIFDESMTSRTMRRHSEERILEEIRKNSHTSEKSRDADRKRD